MFDLKLPMCAPSVDRGVRFAANRMFGATSSPERIQPPCGVTSPAKPSQQQIGPRRLSGLPLAPKSFHLVYYYI